MGWAVAMASQKANIHRKPEHTKTTNTKGSDAKCKACNCSFSAVDIIVAETFTFGGVLLLMAFFFVIAPASSF
jgi:hypothetical protein